MSYWDEVIKAQEAFFATMENVTKKTKNSAPKSIKGDYDLSIHGNKIILVDNIEGATVEAKCSPEDNFDIGEGIKEAFKKLNMKREEIRKQKEEEEEKKIKVGDWVEILYGSYSTNSDFFERNNIMEYAGRFRYGVSPNVGTKGKVVFINTIAQVAVVEVPTEKYYGNPEFTSLDCYDAIYLIGLKGLKKVANPYV